VSEATRRRFLRIKNRLEELNARLGPVVDEEPETALLDPSWGMLGSRLQLNAAGRALDAHMRRLERERRAAEQPMASPPARPTQDRPGPAADW
jgi:hypothetical protein